MTNLDYHPFSARNYHPSLDHTSSTSTLWVAMSLSFYHLLDLYRSALVVCNGSEWSHKPIHRHTAYSANAILDLYHIQNPSRWGTNSTPPSVISSSMSARRRQTNAIWKNYYSIDPAATVGHRWPIWTIGLHSYWPAEVDGAELAASP